VRIYLVSPTHRLPDGSLLKTTRYWTSALTLPYLEALTPKRHEVVMVDELFSDVDLDFECDVVGIGAMGPQIRRAYDLADAFRARGKKVVLGGTWVSLAPEASLAHADAVIVGEADLVWKTVLEDLEAGKSRGIYRADRWIEMRDWPTVDYAKLPLLKWDAFRTSAAYRMYFHWPLVFSRGCPHPCSYCAVQAYYERSYRTRPPESVIEDVRTIKRYGGERLLFLDDNPVAHPDAAKEMFAALIPEKVRWASQCTINIARDPELLDLAARSGCMSLSIGLESLDAESLADVDKKFNKPSRFQEDLAKLRAKGIRVIALMMVGLDHDDPRTFERTLRFLIDAKIPLVKFFTPCPYPGTEYHDEMKAAGRIREADWGRYDYGAALVEPLSMTPEEMLGLFQTTYKKFYSLGSIAKRFWPPPPGHPLETLGYLVANLKTNRFLAKRPEAWGTIS